MSGMNFFNLKNRTELRFRTFKNRRGRYVIEIFDGFNRSTVATFDGVKIKTASTMLSRWANHFLRHELLNLSNVGSNILCREALFSLDNVIGCNGTIKKVLIKDAVGMKNVVAILNAIGYNVETEYDTDKNRMVKILLVKE